MQKADVLLQEPSVPPAAVGTEGRLHRNNPSARDRLNILAVTTFGNSQVCKAFGLLSRVAETPETWIFFALMMFSYLAQFQLRVLLREVVGS